MAPKKKAYEIHGKVTGRKGEPLRDARVVVWWQHIRERKELVAGATSERGPRQAGSASHPSGCRNDRAGMVWLARVQAWHRVEFV